MHTASQRIPVLVTPEQKADIARQAAAAGMKMGEFLRRAAEAYQPAEDEALLAGLVEQVRSSTAAASSAIDEALAYVEASDRRIATRQAQADSKAA